MLLVFHTLLVRAALLLIVSILKVKQLISSNLLSHVKWVWKECEASVKWAEGQRPQVHQLKCVWTCPAFPLNQKVFPLILWKPNRSNSSLCSSATTVQRHVGLTFSFLHGILKYCDNCWTEKQTFLFQHHQPEHLLTMGQSVAPNPGHPNVSLSSSLISSSASPLVSLLKPASDSVCLLLLGFNGLNYWWDYYCWTWTAHQS